MTTFRSHVGLWAFIFFSPILLVILHDGVLCNVAPAYGIGGLDSGACSVGWSIFGILLGYVITIAASIALFVILGIAFSVSQASPEARNKVVALLMWAPLLGVFWADFNLVQVPIARIVDNAEQKRVCESTEATITVRSVSSRSIAIDFADMPPKTVVSLYDSNDKRVVVESLMQEESGQTQIRPVQGEDFIPGEYRIVAEYGDSNCPIAEVPVTVQGFAITGYWNNVVAGSPSKMFFEENGQYGELPLGGSQYVMGTWKFFTAPNTLSSLPFQPKESLTYLGLTSPQGTRYFSTRVTEQDLFLTDIQRGSTLTFLRP